MKTTPTGAGPRLNLAEAKARLKIPDLWRHFRLEGQPAKSCRSPFREDNHPSFSVSGDGTAWFDHGTGEGGGVIEFYSRALGGLSPLTMARDFLAFAEQYLGGSLPQESPEIAQKPAPGASLTADKEDTAGTKLERVLDASRSPTTAECHELGRLRGLEPATFNLAGLLGTLRIGTVCGFKSWILTDWLRIGADARRFDGKPYPAFGELAERKTHSPQGSHKDWPVGIVTDRPEVNIYCERALLVEGSGDYFAALELIAFHGPANILPCAFLGAGARTVHGSALLRLRAFREVLIIPHRDEAGQAAGRHWAEFLLPKGCKPTLKLLADNAPGKDLGEILSRSSEAGKIQFAESYLA